jgi:hypothetical protein
MMNSVKYFPGFADPVFAITASDPERGRHLYDASHPQVQDSMQPHYYPSLVNPTGLSTMEQPHASREVRGSVSSGDMDRGLGIDFYHVGDHRLLASWASYYRDQFIQVKSNLERLQRKHDQVQDQLRRRDADLFVRMIDEQRFLESKEVRDLFLKKPFNMTASVEFHPDVSHVLGVHTKFEPPQ